jgi:hypothetical protein
LAIHRQNRSKLVFIDNNPLSKVHIQTESRI